jgi:hypothetical protein
MHKLGDSEQQEEEIEEDLKLIKHYYRHEGEEVVLLILHYILIVVGRVNRAIELELSILLFLIFPTNSEQISLKNLWFRVFLIMSHLYITLRQRHLQLFI